ncbi:MAG: hypothetical protein A2528_01270 [Candidatus Staskawiczbacteria bacterium RIFOXYD2_FULL_37_9]|uniref:Uncharacterized protein n=1 Tax=Candidatus Staskawiczbacteria bacterium RIFOXYB1_FULL_37_44 TaxID=1802223 RepID=A0A1G2IY98_9BACT|nr:MAG: hypothetical protein A2358_03945 [Candidatus Staskawiczbacteria bacterium RIFOXYB1_FULL_37_44]OGZ83784.1 MAG: hypothetical protein A2416_00180 [Candidatus Staskawiczbacteria bacterium RIFOXYC1_FULL_37_52]OGZ88933.1 MAG: hypothetical protein A2581_01670 [Candidatus Staskawiczbacteria bacterium RIFOXYD1_FULL_37_110]OGZ89576.1 MAG: hypothetical protein A2444_01415 [Candidatus Staskawiczbacteria bacterium RIFOXYC2_FULL_37_19]OGZ94210.1 MAG: hypothetical protein A2528_01270 [Candidatus Stask
MAVDKRTFIIVAVIVAVVLPAIVLVFHRTFFPIIISMQKTFTSAALTNGTTGVPPMLMKLFK